jgi:hypothetical protein
VPPAVNRWLRRRHPGVSQNRYGVAAAAWPTDGDEHRWRSARSRPSAGGRARKDGNRQIAHRRRSYRVRAAEYCNCLVGKRERRLTDDGTVFPRVVIGLAERRTRHKNWCKHAVGAKGPYQVMEMHLIGLGRHLRVVGRCQRGHSVQPSTNKHDCIALRFVHSPRDRDASSFCTVPCSGIAKSSPRKPPTRRDWMVIRTSGQSASGLCGRLKDCAQPDAALAASA